MDVQTYQFSANYNTVPQLDQISDEDSDESEAGGDGSTGDHFTNLFNLAEAADLVDRYNADRDIIPFLGDFTMSTPNISPWKHKHF
jgi:hypothetical protein